MTSVGLALVAGIVGSTLLAAPGEVAEPQKLPGVHEVILPKVDPTIAAGCRQQRAHYAAALAALEDAQHAADEAFYEWYYCMQGGTRPTTDYDATEVPSVLVD